tara:strand:+ start:911 stop:1036 length:126 start_codon:yes stop_codon:yes gene_type:complete
MTWFLIGIVTGFAIRVALAPPYQSEKEKFEDKWNWTGFGGG